MKNKLALLLLVLCWQSTFAAVSVRVCGPDEQTPFDFRKIMVGQKLSLIVSVDPNEYWSGGFFIEGNERTVGRLEARDSDPNTRDFELSHYPAAGDYADVWDWKDSLRWGFDLYSSDSNCVSGDWFILDYIAEKPGQCRVEFYDYNTSWTEPKIIFSFEHAPSCDFNQDGVVNFSDFSQIAKYWLVDDCNDVNDCVAVDLDFDLIVDHNDLAIFSEFWLWDGSIPEPDPNIPPLPAPTPDPNISYSIVDANGLDEITLGINESITFYVDLTTIDQNDLRSFDIEVHISDPNLGSINNIRDPNATAAILATPRCSMFDNWGPAISDETAITFSTYSIALDPNTGMNDGHLVSFVYTANGTGDVVLNVVSVLSRNMDSNAIYPVTKSILIHQSDP